MDYQSSRKRIPPREPWVEKGWKRNSRRKQEKHSSSNNNRYCTESDPPEQQQHQQHPNFSEPFLYWPEKYSPKGKRVRGHISKAILHRETKNNSPKGCKVNTNNPKTASPLRSGFFPVWKQWGACRCPRGTHNSFKNEIMKVVIGLLPYVSGLFSSLEKLQRVQVPM